MPYNEQYVVMEGDEYGAVMAMNSAASANTNVIQYGQAALIMEAQQALLIRLMNLGEKILGPVLTMQPRGCAKFNQQVSDGLKQIDQRGLWSTFGNKPFSPPARLDINYIHSIAKARSQVLEDQLSELQLHPQLFRQHLEGIRDSFIVDNSQFAYGLVMGLVHAYEGWLSIARRCTEVRLRMHGHEAKAANGEELPPSCENALAELEESMKGIIWQVCRGIHGQVPCCKTFKNLFRRYEAASSGTGTDGVLSLDLKWTLSKTFEKDRLFCYLLHIGTFPGPWTPAFPAANLIAALDEHLQRNPKELHRIPVALMGEISDWIATTEIANSLMMHRPGRSFSGPFTTSSLAEAPVMRSYMSPNGEELPEWALLTQILKNPPTRGPKSKPGLEEIRRQRQDADAFWSFTRNRYKGDRKEQLRRGQEVAKQVLATLSMSDKPEYRRVVEQEESRYSSVPRQTPEQPSRAEPPRQGAFDVANIKASLELREGPSKVKTRPAQPATAPATAAQIGPVAEAEPEEAGRTQAQTTAPKIVLPKKSLAVFQSMFAKSPEECSTVSWDAFVHAMDDAGFVARNFGGSAVNFEKSATDAGDGKQSICFHRPHPIPKIESFALRATFGRRLANRFGWHRDLFALAEKN